MQLPKLISALYKDRLNRSTEQLEGRIHAVCVRLFVCVCVLEWLVKGSDGRINKRNR